MTYIGNVSTIIGNTATVELKAHNIVTGLLKVPTHITTLLVGDTVACLFTSNDFQQGIIIAKIG